MVEADELTDRWEESTEFYHHAQKLSEMVDGLRMRARATKEEFASIAEDRLRLVPQSPSPYATQPNALALALVLPPLPPHCEPNPVALYLTSTATPSP